MSGRGKSIACIDRMYGQDPSSKRRFGQVRPRVLCRDLRSICCPSSPADPLINIYRGACCSSRSPSHSPRLCRSSIASTRIKTFDHPFHLFAQLVVDSQHARLPPISASLWQSRRRRQTSIDQLRCCYLCVSTIVDTERTVLMPSAFGSFLFGYDSGIIGSVISGSYTHFHDYFEAPKAGVIGAIVSLFAAGAFFGAIMAGWTADKFGRKRTIQIGSVIAIVGCTLQTAAVNVGMLIAGRFIAGWSIGVLSMIVPMYQAEISPPHARGLLSGWTQLMIGKSPALLSRDHGLTKQDGVSLLPTGSATVVDSSTPMPNGEFLLPSRSSPPSRFYCKIAPIHDVAATDQSAACSCYHSLLDGSPSKVEMKRQRPP